MDKQDEIQTGQNADQRQFSSRLSTREASLFKGLPEENARIELARTYLEMQASLWPELTADDVLPKLTRTTLELMSTAFERRYMGNEDPTELDFNLSGNIAVGIAYVRYSSDNSNPRSLDQQLKLILECAARNRVYIPWQLVFADAGMTGRTSLRRGYQMAKAAVKSQKTRIYFLVIDEIGRASRDAIESLQLGRLMEQYSVRMLGASDNFDSGTQQSKMMLHFLAMTHESFVDQLKAKVNRGIRDAFENGRHVGMVPVGYRLETITDDFGNPMLSPSKKICNQWLIDDEPAKQIRLAFEQYVEQGRSPIDLAKQFSNLRVGNRTNWDARRIRELMRRPIYKGLHTHGMSFAVINPDTGAIEKRQRPRKEWRTKELPHLKIVSDELWQQANDKLDHAAEMYKKDRKPKPSRTGLYPTKLFRPFCGSCKLKLWVGHSGRNPSFTCASNSKIKFQCKYKGNYKSAKIVDTAILDYLFNQLFSEEFIDRVVVDANQTLERIKNEPTADVEQMRKDLKRKKRSLEALSQKMAEQTEVQNLQPVFDQIARLDREAKDLQKQIDKVVSDSSMDVPPITKVDLVEMLKDLRSLLSEDVAAAAKVLEGLTGPISIEQRANEKGGKSEWWAHFELQGAKAFVLLARRKKYPTTGSWEFLTACGWIIGGNQAVRVEAIPKYVFFLQELHKSWQETKNASCVGARHNMFLAEVNEALEMTPRHELPVKYVPPYVSRVNKIESKCITLGPDVVHLRNEQGQKFTEIARILKVGAKIVSRAYHRAIKHVVKDDKKSDPLRMKYSLTLPASTYEKIDELAKTDMTQIAIAKEAGCSAGTVSQRIKKLKKYGRLG